MVDGFVDCAGCSVQPITLLARSDRSGANARFRLSQDSHLNTWKIKRSRNCGKGLR